MWKEIDKDITRLYIIIEQLPKPHREFLLLYLDGVEDRLLARKMGINENQIEIYKREACIYLRKYSPHLWGIVVACLFRRI